MLTSPACWLLSRQLKTKQKKEEEFLEDRQKLQDLHDRLREQQEGLAPIEKRVALARDRVAGLRKRDLAELQDFVAEATVSPVATSGRAVCEGELAPIWLRPSGAPEAGCTECSCEAGCSVGWEACRRGAESDGFAAPRAGDAPADSSAPPADTDEVVRCSPRSAWWGCASELPPPPSPAAAAVPLPGSKTRAPEEDELRYGDAC